MTIVVSGLMDFLATQPPDRLVVMAKDAEGNGYSPLEDVREGMYLAESAWSGDMYVTPEQLAENIRDRFEQGWTDEDAAPDAAVRVVVLGPVN